MGRQKSLDSCLGNFTPFARTQLTTAIGEVLSMLSTPDQLLLTLRFVDGYSPERVGRILGLGSRFQVYRRLKVVIGEVRDRLREKGITEG